MKTHLTIFALMVSLVLGSELQAQNQALQRMISSNLRTLGMGGAAVAVPISDNPFFYNPALLAGVGRARLNLVDLRFRFNQAFFDQLKFYRDHREQINDTENLTPEEQNQLFSEALQEAQKLANVIVDGPLPINYVQRNFGIGLFTQGDLQYEIFAGASGLPVLNVALKTNIALMTGYAISVSGLLPHPIHIGVAAKYLIRAQTQKTKSLLSFSEEEEFEVYEGQAFSFDLGLIYPITHNLHFGMAFYDVNRPEIEWRVNVDNPVTPMPETRIEKSMRMGIAYYPRMRLGKLFYNLRFALDIDEPFNSDITFFKKVFFGAEANITSIIFARGGFYQGYPAFGVGVNFHVIRLNFAFYGEELGKYAGEFVSWTRAVSVQVGI
ncbi:MAG: hypothetical protein Q9P14_02535 [candidate division KSB1 bacterium]|nr:hypothetical protein [candidate division KSB1 bacterium]